MKPRFFRTAEDLRTWLTKNHDSAPELWIGFYKKASGKKGIAYKDAVDQALCFGWIDGVRRGIDEVSYTTRFSRRVPKSPWSRINIARVKELKKLGLMAKPGIDTFERRDKASAGYSYEDGPHELGPEYVKEFRKRKGPWTFFESQPAGYKRAACHWVMTAKRDDTRRRRLTQLIEDSANGRRLALLSSPSRRT
jgi:uncharacterized protein YdeI (YjbR/CyaY-like superfamily)